MMNETPAASVTFERTLSQLRAFGECTWKVPRSEPDYSSFEWSDQAREDLIEVLFMELLGETNESDVWTPVHAWRLLARHRAKEALPQLVDLLADFDADADDWTPNELPGVIASFGGDAVAAITQAYRQRAVSRASQWGWAGLAETLGEIAKSQASDPQGADAARLLLRRMLADFEVLPPTVTASVVGQLADLRDQLAVPAIVRVYERQYLDEDYVTWRDVVDAYRDSVELPQSVQVQPYQAMPIGEYQGHEHLRRLLAALGMGMSLTGVRAYFMGLILAEEVVSAPQALQEMMLDEEGNEIEFETEGQMFYVIREVTRLWNEQTDFVETPFELVFSVPSEGLDPTTVAWLELMQIDEALTCFVEGLKRGGTTSRKVRDPRAADFLTWAAREPKSFEAVRSLAGEALLTGLQECARRVKARWSQDYVHFATAVRRQRLEAALAPKASRQGRNERCQCGSGKKFKYCCGHQVH